MKAFLALLLVGLVSAAIFPQYTPPQQNAGLPADIEERLNTEFETLDAAVGERYQFSTAVLGNHAFVISGVDVSNNTLADVVGYNFISETWAPVTTVSTPRSIGVAVVINRRVIFAGGHDGVALSAVVDHFDEFGRDLTVTGRNDALSLGRFYLSAATAGQYAFFAGGAGAGPLDTDIIDFYDAATDRIELLGSHTLSLARSASATASVGTKAIFFGGINAGNPVDNIDIYDYSTDQWTTQSDTVSCDRGGASVAVVGDIAIFFGGFTGVAPVAAHDAIELYNAATGQWVNLAFPDPANPNAATTGAYALSGAAKLGHLALFAGGTNGVGTASHILIFNTYTGRWSKSGALNAAYEVPVTGVSNGRKALFFTASGASRFQYLVSVPNERDPILEWSFTFQCGGFTIPGTHPNDAAQRPIDIGQDQLKASIVHVEGIINRNEWECERFTTNLGRESTSCLPSQLVVKPLILKRPLSTNEDFWDWRDQVANGQLAYARDNCDLTMFGRDYRPVFAWRIKNAWPASIGIETHGTMIPGFQEPGKFALLEVITIIHEGLTRFGHESENKALGKILPV